VNTQQKMFAPGLMHLYLRISKDDDGSGESASIKTQREILYQYAASHGFLVAGEYVDDGFSGTNYDRPEFQRMCRDIEAGRVQCIATKDMSRLGRNSARTTDLLEEYFPAHQVRYIAVSEGYDSQHMTGGMAMTAPLMMVMNEMYARDTSCKIRSAFQSKMESGQYIGHYAPYGYQKDPENKNHLVIDYQVAGIVAEMFRAASLGVSPGQIAKGLNEKAVPTPSMYRQEKSGSPVTPHQWTSHGVCKLLKNPVYQGDLAQGRTTKISFKSKDVLVRPPEEWTVVRGTHEAIVSQDLFQQVQRRVIRRKNHPSGGFQNVFSGIAFCADCGRNMTATASRKRGTSYNLCCGGYKNTGSHACTNHFIDYNFLRDTVWQEIKTWLDLSPDERNALAENLQKAQTKKQSQTGRMTDALEEMQQRQRVIQSVLKKLYEDQATGKISMAFFEAQHEEYTKEWQSLQASISQLTSQQAALDSSQSAYDKFFVLLDETMDRETLTKPILHKLVERIEVSQGHYERDSDGTRKKRQKVRIIYKFIGNINFNCP
jgi:DNA invertase Pin-like site-specific DNA recombinase